MVAAATNGDPAKKALGVAGAITLSLAIGFVLSCGAVYGLWMSQSVPPSKPIVSAVVLGCFVVSISGVFVVRFLSRRKRKG